MLQWYALEVTLRLAHVVGSFLQREGIEVYVPMYACPRQWADRIVYRDKPLFPGYVLCRLDMERSFMPILMTPGVKGIVKLGRHPQPISDDEITSIRRAVDSGLARPWEYLQIGQTVRIGNGPMRGLTGILVRAQGAHRVVVSIAALRSSIAVEIDPKCLISEAALTGHSR